MTHSITWRQSSERVAMAQSVLNTSEMAAMLAVLELDHPAKERVPAKIINDGFGATHRLGMIDGFEQCLSMLRNLGKPLPLPMQNIETTWGVAIEEAAKAK